MQFNDRDAVIEILATGGCGPGGADRETGDGVIQWCLDPDSGIYLYANAFTQAGEEVLDATVASLEIRAVRA